MSCRQWKISKSFYVVRWVYPALQISLHVANNSFGFWSLVTRILNQRHFIFSKTSKPDKQGNLLLSTPSPHMAIAATTVRFNRQDPSILWLGSYRTQAFCHKAESLTTSSSTSTERNRRWDISLGHRTIPNPWDWKENTLFSFLFLLFPFS